MHQLNYLNSPFARIFNLDWMLDTERLKSGFSDQQISSWYANKSTSNELGILFAMEILHGYNKLGHLAHQMLRNALSHIALRLLPVPFAVVGARIHVPWYTQLRRIACFQCKRLELWNQYQECGFPERAVWTKDIVEGRSCIRQPIRPSFRA